MKVVVLGIDTDTTWTVVNELEKDFPRLALCLENPVSRYGLLKGRLRKVGFLTVGGQLLFMLYMSIIRKLSLNRIRRLFDELGLDSARPDRLNVFHVTSVNSPECIEWLKRESPDIVVLNGTRIVSSKVLNSIDSIFINLHCGITPAYRGVHGAYWAFYKNDEANAGVTVHVVDAGIDTGDILYQSCISRLAEDNFLTYPIRQYHVGIPLLKKAIADVSKGNMKKFKRPDLGSSIWMHPTLLQYLYARWFRGVK
ncbi:formyl transferase [Pseudomonas sp. JBR1]|uniref:formyl transferase n=1 Tax=Pseudomonas sp. JBR1 TaxID=3020907 RepID=UPI0023050F88|nr:formyl transferase [Pseudomonas sp. JBR1]WCE07568.1 formyl transferase [Pseudomonas sp. JBR1]